MDNLCQNNEKIMTYNYLMELYIDTICKLMDDSKSLGILPFKVIIGMGWIKKHISENRFETLQNGIEYLLTNKETILNFDLNKLDELDEDMDDNISIKSYVNKFNKKNNNISQSNIETPDEMLNLIIEIKNNTKKLLDEDILIIKKYFELLIIILEKIQDIFLS